MARDESLLYASDLAPAALRIYRWSPPTLSLGYFQSMGEIAQLPAAYHALPVVRRLTGGGAILHDQEITYCLVLSDSVEAARRPPAELYRRVHICWRDAIAADGVVCALAPEEFPLPSPRSGPFFCFAKPGRTDLLLDSRKVLGSAQRRIPGRVMQHGSLILAPGVAEQGGTHLSNPPASVVELWVDRFVERLCAALELGPRAAEWSAARRADSESRRGRYASDDFRRLR